MLRRNNFEIGWTGVEGAATYQVQVADNENFENPVIDRKSIDSFSVEADGLDFKKYFVRIRCVECDGYVGGWSKTTQFILKEPPPLPLFEAPEISDTVVKLRWKDLEIVDRYRFQLSMNPEFEEVLIDAVIPIPEYRLLTPAKAGQYYYRVLSIESDGYEGEFTPPKSFVINEKHPVELKVTGFVFALFALLL